MKKTMMLLSILVVVILMQLMQLITSSSNNINSGPQVVSLKIRLIQWQIPPACYLWIGESKQLWANCLNWSAGGVIRVTQVVSSQHKGSDGENSGKKILIRSVSYQKKDAGASVINGVIDFINQSSYSFIINRDLVFSRLGTEGLLAEALTFGQSGLLSNQLKEELRLAGLQHLVSVSNYCFHLTIELLFFFTTKFSTHKKFLEILTLLCLGYIVVLMGFPAVLQRTFLAMGISLCAQRIFHRPILSLYRLLLSSLILLLIEPMAFFEIGFQFAVMASLGLQIFRQPPKKMLMTFFFLPMSWRIKISKIIWTSISAQLLTWPLILFYFGQLSLTSPLSCLLICWILPIILPLGVGYWVVSQIHAGLAVILGQILKLPIQIFMAELQILSNSSHVIYFQPDTVLMALGYCLIAFFLFCLLIKHKRYVRRAFFNNLYH